MLISLCKSVVSVSRNLIKNPVPLAVLGLFMIGAFFCPGIVCAQSDPVTIPVQEFNFDFGGFVSSIWSNLIIVIAAAAGLGLSIWAIRYGFRLFRSMGR